MVETARGLIASLVLSLASTAVAQELVAHGGCRDGAAHGAYELRSSDGQLRIAGAFNHGKRTGSFIFWTRDGTRIAHIPYDEDHVSGTVSLWFERANGSDGEAQQKLQAAFTTGRRNGVTRSWYPNGQPRAIYRYEQGELVDAKAWSASGVSLPESEARELALSDRDQDEKYYASLDATVTTHLPACEEESAAPSRASLPDRIVLPRR